MYSPFGQLPHDVLSDPPASKIIVDHPDGYPFGCLPQQGLLDLVPAYVIFPGIVLYVDVIGSQFQGPENLGEFFLPVVEQVKGVGSEFFTADGPQEPVEFSEVPQDLPMLERQSYPRVAQEVMEVLRDFLIFFRQ